MFRLFTRAQNVSYYYRSWIAIGVITRKVFPSIKEIAMNHS